MRLWGLTVVEQEEAQSRKSHVSNLPDGQTDERNNSGTSTSKSRRLSTLNDDNDGIDTRALAEFLSTEARNSVNLTIKNYKLQDGLSSKFFADNDGLFGLTGPLGKGLGLTPNSKGVHIAFSAGTGILPYVDMVAKLLLQEMGQLPDDDEHFHDDFNLVMYVGFQNR